MLSAVVGLQIIENLLEKHECYGILFTKRLVLHFADVDGG
jgi:hypothetical protein